MPAAQKSRAKDAEPYAVIAGTVFRDPGFAVPGAEVTLLSAGGPSGSKPKKLKEVSNSRGEFAFRVPPGPAEYKVTATAKGFNLIEKQVQIHGEERVDVTFVLAPSSNK